MKMQSKVRHVQVAMAKILLFMKLYLDQEGDHRRNTFIVPTLFADDPPSTFQRKEKCKGVASFSLQFHSSTSFPFSVNMEAKGEVSLLL